MVNVKFYGLLRLMLKQDEINLNINKEIKIKELLNIIQKEIKEPFLHKLIDDNDKIIPGTIILINRKNIFHLKLLESIVRDNDKVALFPPGAGG